MIQPALLSALLLTAAIALLDSPASALCVDEGSLSLERDAAPDEDSFVSSSPASSESELRFEVDLGDLASPSSPDDTEADTIADRPGMDEADPMADTEPMEDPATTNPAVADFESATATDAGALGVVEAEEQPPISREDYLNTIADDLNNCL